jgi:hypothetical protein
MFFVQKNRKKRTTGHVLHEVDWMNCGSKIYFLLQSHRDFWGVICQRKLQTEKQFIDSIWANKQKKLNWILRVARLVKMRNASRMLLGKPGENLTFRGPCIVIYSYNKIQQDAPFLNFILVKISTCFGQIYCLSSRVLIL